MGFLVIKHKTSNKEQIAAELKLGISCLQQNIINRIAYNLLPKHDLVFRSILFSETDSNFSSSDITFHSFSPSLPT